MSGTNIKPWNKVVRLRDEVRTGQLSLQEFAADLFDVVNPSGKRPLYEDPASFFSLTYATSSLRDIVAATAERLRGNSAKAIRQLELTYGGGKTHTMVTLTHLFRNPDALPAVPSVKEFESAMGGKAPKSRISAVCFDKLDQEKGVPVIGPDGSTRMLKQPWSVIAFQLAGSDGLRILHGEGKDEERDSPPRDLLLEELISLPVKKGLGVLILFDEVLMYAGELAKHPVTGEQFREQFINFLQSLTQAVAKVDRASLIVSLLASDPKRDDEFGRQLLADMSNVLGRKEDESFQPVGKDDVAEILRRRLLDPETTKDIEAFRPNVVAVVKALSTKDNPDFAKTPAQRDVREKQYLASFPFDPALMDVFYVKWTSGLPLFQRTRGILRTFAVALRDAEAWDTSPIAGVSILLSKPGEEKLSSALGDLAGVAGVAQVDGAMQNWNAILEAELRFARQSQEQLPSLSNREIEQGVVATFVHSQPPGNHHAKTTDLLAMIGSGKPDGIALEKGLQGWAGKSWYLDETHLDSAEKRADGTRGVPRTWRLGNQPNLKQMHDDARLTRVAKSAVDDMLTDEIKKANYLTAGADALGAKVHKMPLDPKEVPNDGEFRYVLLGPNGQSESGKPSSLAVRFCDEVTGSESPRSAKNAILLAVPDRSGLTVAQDKIRDHLAWVDVKAQLSGQVVDPVRASKLDTEITGSKRDIGDAIRQAYCIVVTRGADDVVHAFKVTVDSSKPLFATIKEDAKARIKDITLAPDLLLPGGDYDLWRADEDRRRVKTIIGAFAERPSLPKMLRRKDLLETVANGCQQGLFVLALKRPNGSFRTWWRTMVDETALSDDTLEAIQNSSAILESIDASLMVPGKLEGLDWDAGVKIGDLVAYFNGHVVSIEHPEDNWTEEKIIPRCPEAKVLEAVSEAVAAGSVWIISGPASVWGEMPATGVVSKAAILRRAPESIDVSSLTPEALPDAWTAGKTNALAMGQALASQRAVTALPWKLIETAISGAMSSGFLSLIPGGVTWPCQSHEAGAAEFGIPESGKASPLPVGGGGGGGGGFGNGPQAILQPKRNFREAVLDSSQLADLVDKTEDIFGAAGALTVRFRVSVEFGDGENASPDVAAKLSAVLKEVSDDFE
jgi:hypothetical protein